jgi:site-specific DNA-cytosine methylase
MRREKNNIMEKEPKILRSVRTEKAKELRRQGIEAFANRQYEPNPAPTSNTISTVQKDNMLFNPEEYRIRKLTPRECFRLMDVSDEDIDKIQAAGISKSQQYKLAGNSIVCSVLYHIFKAMFIEQAQPTEPRQLELF